MSLEALIGLAVVAAVSLGIFGLVKRFPWFIIQGALINGPIFVAALWGLFTGLLNGLSAGGGWWALFAGSIPVAYVCGSNVKHFLDGSEAEMFYKAVREKMRQGDDD